MQPVLRRLIQIGQAQQMYLENNNDNMKTFGCKRDARAHDQLMILLVLIFHPKSRFAANSLP